MTITAVAVALWLLGAHATWTLHLAEEGPNSAVTMCDRGLAFSRAEALAALTVKGFMVLTWPALWAIRLLHGALDHLVHDAVG